MKKILISFAALAMMMPANAQFFNRLVDRARESAEQSVERQVEKKVEDGVEKIFNPETGEYEEVRHEEVQPAQVAPESQPQQGWTCPKCGAKGQTGNFCTECGAKKPDGDGSWTCSKCGAKGQTGKFCTECGTKKPEAGEQAVQPQKNAAEAAYAKSDFVPGDEIMFEDDQANEQLGEFPSKWDLLAGNAEIATINGRKAINLTDPSTELIPLMKDQKNYLTEAFTLEFDYLGGKESENIYCDYFVHLRDINDEWIANISCSGVGDGTIHSEWKTPNADSRSQSASTPLKEDDWNHFALSFNKRALKVYINGTRVVNIPNCVRPQQFSIQRSSWDDHRNFITNIRLCKGAVPLYNRLMTDGKIITYAITFDIGKATIKPESMTEINRIANLMKENADLRFEVQGHTDNTGTVAGNQKLSEQRAQAIVDKLVSMGIDANRLSAKGIGQSSPLTDNSTDEGRAKNRRVEFVKK